MLTFDDGYIGNYENALQILEQNSMTGYFLVSSDLVGNVGYMKAEQLKDLIKRGHIIGDHTATHHRMMEDDTKETLEYEIKESKIKLEKMLDTKINIFCWCGGEEEHYTKKAYDKIINAKYKYGFMTNSAPVICSTNRMHIQRINIEDSWSISLTKLQVSGFMDKHFEAKRKRVDIKLKEIEGI
jgi:peptidoglycan/xylan/chitin deacetylase (PgdA/CDA1 family)